MVANMAKITIARKISLYWILVIINREKNTSFVFFPCINNITNVIIWQACSLFIRKTNGYKQNNFVDVIIYSKETNKQYLIFDEHRKQNMNMYKSRNQSHVTTSLFLICLISSLSGEHRISSPGVAFFYFESNCHCF